MEYDRTQKLVRRLAYGQGLLLFGFLLYLGCAGTPKISSEQETAMQARERARQDSIARFELNKNWSLGNENYKNKEYNRVAKYFWQVIKYDKDHRFRDVYSFLANTYFNLSKIDSAEIVYQMGLQVFPDNAHLHRSLGYIYENKQQIAEAIAEYEQVVKLEPDNVDDWQRLANLYVRVNRVNPEAINAYKRIIDLKPDDPEPRKTLIALMQTTGDENAIINSMIDALAKNPNDTSTRFDLAKAYANQRNWDNAAKQYELLLAITPNDLVSRQELARMYENLERYQKAIDEYKKILQAKPDDKLSLAETAFCYKELNQLSTSRSFARKALNVDRNYGYAHIVLGQIYERSVDECQAKAERKSANFDDKLVYEMAYKEYEKALGDLETKQRAQNLMASLEPVIPTQGDRFMNKGVTKARSECYAWLYQ